MTIFVIKNTWLDILDHHVMRTHAQSKNRTIMGSIHIHNPKSVMEMEKSCRFSVCDGHMSAGEHMCNQNMQHNDTQLSEYRFSRLQTKIDHVTYLLESDELHLSLCWWLDSSRHSWTASCPHFLQKTALAHKGRLHDAFSVLLFMTTAYYVDIDHHSSLSWA